MVKAIEAIRIEPLKTKQFDKLKVNVFDSRRSLGVSAGIDAAAKIKELLASQKQLRMIFAAAPSQNEFLETLCTIEGIDWSRITVFHMDEYIGLSVDAPQRFARYLCNKLFDRVQPREVLLIDSTQSSEEECARYSALLQQAPIDIVCLGIGENGHIAFNDPAVANFQDEQTVKVVELDTACRQQQVNDRCFAEIGEVPTHAMTLTIPTLMSGKHLFCMVPGLSKRVAVRRTLNEAISIACPATILRQHPDCSLYVDMESYGE
ncbi:glucosamine-6-phosphate deaminase [Paenibacillus sp. yr247]|uniref:glucosamine-6-phosphate deaminase n=1 Tax=Paenibacillus sp. yr247 TaxID=1761880 RepID=UPI00088C02B0|nr:glucosamine-6-phosphate deaminase [Paenibacillus sp. yr247]SDO37755.1 glucosamine-6-phosphate deaminase [Paenibacillus sp. yr247]